MGSIRGPPVPSILDFWSHLTRFPYASSNFQLANFCPFPCTWSVTFLSNILSQAYNKTSSLTWAVVVACHGAASDFAGITILRVLLGVFESTISPGLSLVTSVWYKRSEHASRHGIWFAGNSISSIFGGLLTYGIGHIDNSVEPWRVCCLSLLSFPKFLSKTKLTVHSGYSLYSASSPSHMESYSCFYCQMARAMPGSFPKKRENSSTDALNRRRAPNFRKYGQKVNVLKHS